MTDFLETLKKELSDDWDPRYVPAGKDVPYPRLMENLGPMILSVVQLSQAQRSAGVSPQSSDVDRLQMYAQLPFTVESDNLQSTAMLLSQLNARLPILGFIIAMSGDTVAMRHLHLFNPQRPDYVLIEEAMTQIKFAVANYTELIHAVSSGRLSDQQAIEQL